MARSIFLPLLLASALGCNAFDEPNEEGGGASSQPGSAPFGGMTVGSAGAPKLAGGAASVMPPSAGFAGTGGSFAGTAGTAGSFVGGSSDAGPMDASGADLEDGGSADAAN